MIYSILIYSSPMQLSGPSSALKFARELLKAGHSIYRVFLYGEAIYLSNTQAVFPQGDHQLHKEWSEFLKSHNIDAVVCIAAALKRGVLNKEESIRYDKTTSVLDNSYDLSGLGQLIDASVQSDRLITFN